MRFCIFFLFLISSSVFSQHVTAPSEPSDVNPPTQEQLSLLKNAFCRDFNNVRNPNQLFESDFSSLAGSFEGRRNLEKERAAKGERVLTPPPSAGERFVRSYNNALTLSSTGRDPVLWKNQLDRMHVFMKEFMDFIPKSPPIKLEYTAFEKTIGGGSNEPTSSHFYFKNHGFIVSCAPMHRHATADIMICPSANVELKWGGKRAGSYQLCKSNGVPAK